MNRVRNFFLATGHQRTWCGWF